MFFCLQNLHLTCICSDVQNSNNGSCPKESISPYPKSPTTISFVGNTETVIPPLQTSVGNNNQRSQQIHRVAGPSHNSDRRSVMVNGGVIGMPPPERRHTSNSSLIDRHMVSLFIATKI